MPRILIVEDDPMISEIYQKKFTDSGFDVLTAVSGEQVLTVAKTEKIDVILLDLIMPKMDGFEIMQNLRGGNYDPNIKIIVFSNLNQGENREKALSLGANSFIAKSEYTPTDLVKEVKRLLGQFQEQEKNEKNSNGAINNFKISGNKKILMIEDEDVFIEMFGEKLKQEGYEVAFARNGAWGMREAMKGIYDLFIIDMIMPAMTGEEMIGKLKMEDKTKNIPIIMLSASVEDQHIRKIEEMGVDAFFEKTQITPTDLSKKVGEIFETRKQ